MWGRFARHGAAMMGPNYTWWHSFHEVAQHFYLKYIPEARELDNPELNALIDKLLKDDPIHRWLNQPTNKLKQMIKNGEMQKVYESLFAGKE